MDDLISRQAAIDGKICIQRANGVEIYDDYAVPVEYLKQLPPANCSEFPNSSDTISRQAAIDALDEQIEQCDKSLSSFYISMKDEYAVKVERASLVAFRETLEYLLPAEPKTGRWLYCEDTTADCVDGYRCDQCGFFVPWDYQHKGIDFIQDYNFCPRCGAKMEVTE